MIETLKDRKMTMGDLKYLPACEVKDILEGGKHSDSKTAANGIQAKHAQLMDGYSEENVKVQQRVIDRVKENVGADIPFEGAYIAEFSQRTMKEHAKLSKMYKTEVLNHKITEQGSMYGKASMEVSDRLLELRANCEISKVESMFEDHKISAHYEKFQEKAL